MRAKITDEVRKAIIEKEESGGDNVQLAADLGVKRTTAIGIVKRGLRIARKRGGSRRSRTKMTEEMMRKVIYAIEENPSVTLKTLADDVLMRQVSQSTIYRHLDGRLITYKMVRYEPVSRNSEANIEKRKRFAMDYQRETRRKVHLDEMNFNLFCLRKFGRSAIGARALVPVRTSKGTNLNIILAVDDSGTVVLQQTHMWSIKDKFKEFMDELSLILTGEEVIIYMDNAPIHVKEENFSGVSELHTIRRFDAPYSPQLNPVEGCFSILKASIKRTLATINPQNDLSGAGDSSLRAYRAGILRDAFQESVPELTRAKIRNLYRRVDAIVADCAQGLHLEG